MISDEDANDLCESIEDMILHAVEKYELSFLEVAAVMVGRITAISEELELNHEMSTLFGKGISVLTEQRKVH